MKRKLALTSRLHSVRAHSSDEEEDGLGEKWIAMRRSSIHKSQMKAKRRAANKACWKQFEERAREEKQRLIVDLDVNGTRFLIYSIHNFHIKLYSELSRNN